MAERSTTRGVPNAERAATQYPRLATVAKPGWKLRLEKRVGLLRALEIMPYRSHGTPYGLQVKGRLIERPRGGNVFSRRSARLTNVWQTLQRIASDEIPGALIEAECAGIRQTCYTDAEGYFVVNLWAPKRPYASGWHEVQLRLLDSIGGAGHTAIAHCLVPSAEAEFAVISDLDDTVIESSAFNRLTHFKLTLLKDAAGRTPVKEAAPLYRRLVKGPCGEGNNPIFYLSRSGWNLNDLFEEFLDLQGLPPGPMFLRDLALREAKSLSLGTGLHKIETVRYLLQAYPRLSFVLLGDSGQRDPETYWQIAIENPGRIKAIYLHDVGRARRDRKVAAIARDLEARGVPVVHAQSLTDYAPHMAKLKLIG